MAIPGLTSGDLSRLIGKTGLPRPAGYSSPSSFPAQGGQPGGSSMPPPVSSGPTWQDFAKKPMSLPAPASSLSGVSQDPLGLTGGQTAPTRLPRPMVPQIPGPNIQTKLPGAPAKGSGGFAGITPLQSYKPPAGQSLLPPASLPGSKIGTEVQPQPPAPAVAAATMPQIGAEQTPQPAVAAAPGTAAAGETMAMGTEETKKTETQPKVAAATGTAAAGETPATGTTPAVGPDGQPVSTAPASPYQSSMDELKALLASVTDLNNTQVKAAINRAVTNASLMNQAERDALQMQINQDPSLRGQGAGYAMLAVMARDQGFSLDQMLGQLSSDNIERIINLQKYGFEMGQKLNEIEYNRNQDAVKNLLAAGDFDAAAAVLNKTLGQQFPGLNINVSAANLKGRDPQALTQLSQRINFISDLAKSGDTKGALVLATSLMNDPIAKDYFPDGMTPEQFVQSMTTGQVSANLQASQPIQTAINNLALTGQSFDETGTSYHELFRLTGRNAEKEGRSLLSTDDGLAEANKILSDAGLGSVSRDSQGNFVDENGIPLDSEDLSDLAYRKDYADRVKQANVKPWEQMKKMILESPMGKYFLDENLYPGANDALDKFLMSYSLSADAFTRDPKTGEIVPNWDKLNLSLNSPEMWPVFHNWPTGAFDENGNVVSSTPGGYVYGEEVNGKKIVSTPEDQALDQAYFAYRNSGGTLNAQEWYFATAGGKNSKPDVSKVPESVPGNRGSATLGTSETAGSKTLTGVPTPETRKVSLTMFTGLKLKNESKLQDRVTQEAKTNPSITLEKAKQMLADNSQRALSLTSDEAKKAIESKGQDQPNYQNLIQPFDYYDPAEYFTACALAFGVDVAQQIYKTWSGGKEYSGALAGGYKL